MLPFTLTALLLSPSMDNMHPNCAFKMYWFLCVLSKTNHDTRQRARPGITFPLHYRRRLLIYEYAVIINKDRYREHKRKVDCVVRDVFEDKIWGTEHPNQSSWLEGLAFSLAQAPSDADCRFEKLVSSAFQRAITRTNRTRFTPFSSDVSNVLPKMGGHIRP